jgi:hypothetical protein
VNWANRGNLRGPQGIPGTPGTNGSNGTNGNTILSGAANPASGTGVNGDFYLNTTTSVLFGPKAGGAWPGTGTSLVGPSTPQTIPDPLSLGEVRGTTLRVGTVTTNPTITQGSAAPSATAPAGSLYLRTGAATTPGQRLYWNANGTSTGWVPIDGSRSATTRYTYTSGSTTPALTLPAGNYIRCRGRYQVTTDGPVLGARLNGVSTNSYAQRFDAIAVDRYVGTTDRIYLPNSPQWSPATFDLTIWRENDQLVCWQCFGSTPYENRNIATAGYWSATALTTITFLLMSGTFTRFVLDIWGES